MAKIDRVLQKIFGGSAVSSGRGGIGQFGSLAGSSPALSKNVQTLQALAPWTTGWIDAIVGNNSPALEDLNGFCYVATAQLAYLFQSGIAEWETNTVYYTNSVVTYQGLTYQSVVDTNSGNIPLGDVTNWKPYSTTPTGTLEACAAISTPAGWLDCDGSALSRTTYATLFAALSITTTGNSGSGVAVLTGLGTTTGMVAGYPISGPNIPAGTTVLSIDSGTQIHISQNTTGANTGATFVVAPWGIGNGTTTFNVPDLRGQFLRGVGTNGTLQTSNGGSVAGPILGATQNDQEQGHTHSVAAAVQNINGTGAGTWSNSLGRGNSLNTGTGSGGDVGGPTTDGTNGTPRSGAETRPFNAGVKYIIKY